MLRLISNFFQIEAASSIILAIMVAIAMVAANSPLATLYDQLHTPVFTLAINDGLMSLFFLVIGIELKRELAIGSLCTPRKAILPVMGALGGVVAPSMVFAWFNADTYAMRGWAIPMATDIAFALGLVGFYGSRLPASLRAFLMALAVIDDLMAILVIALFYSGKISYEALAMAAGIMALLFVYNRKTKYMAPFLFAGAALWIALHESGIHATLAGVALGLFLPLDKGEKVLARLHGPVAFFVAPLFVFANAGVTLAGIELAQIMEPLPMGIMTGLFFGKQFGIFGVSWFMVRAGFATRPEGASWAQFYGVCLVAGIGFTMSLFIGALAFGHSDLMEEARLGVILGSLASAAFGAILLAATLPAKDEVHAKL